MKMRLLSALLVPLLLTGCAAGGSGLTADPTGDGVVQPVQEISGQVEIPELPEGGDAEAEYASFATELLRRCRTEGENTLVSPLSVALALGMTANGAAGDTLAEFQQLLGMDLDTLNAWCAAALQTYGELGGSTEATLVNSLWCDPDLALEDQFVERCRQNYAAQVYQGNLQDPAVVQAVNDWVSEATEALIPQVVEKFSPDAVLALVNAIYLKNRFQVPFETPSSEWEMDFTAANGTVSHPKGMTNGGRTEQYLSHEGGSGVVLPYDDGRLGFLLMLPEEGTGLAEYLASWDGETVMALLENRSGQQVKLLVPSYELEWSASLQGILPAMGLAGAFHPDTADFTAMGTSANGPLFIGDVIHKTVLKVNEKGTEAAAVTAVVMETGAAMPEEQIVLRFDRPFVCGIVDMETGAPLFLGTVETL